MSKCHIVGNLMHWLKYDLLSINYATILANVSTPVYLISVFHNYYSLLLDFSLTVKAATLIFISGRGSAISSAKEGKSGFIYNLVKN